MRKNRCVRVLVFNYFCPQKFQRHQTWSSTECLPKPSERFQYSEHPNTQDTGSKWTEKRIMVQATQAWIVKLQRLTLAAKPFPFLRVIPKEKLLFWASCFSLCSEWEENTKNWQVCSREQQKWETKPQGSKQTSNRPYQALTNSGRSGNNLNLLQLSADLTVKG